MTDAEFAREIVQPLTDQLGDYGAHSQSWRERKPRLPRFRTSAFGVRCVLASLWLANEPEQGSEYKMSEVQIQV
jgi:hypothetical protein